VACGHCGKSWWVVTRCKLRVCPLCEYEVAKKRGEFLLQITSEMKYPKQLTLTLPVRQKELREGILKLRKAWNRIRRWKLFERMTGGAYHIEAKAKPDGWHVHMHILMDAPYLPYQQIFTAWCKVLKVNFVEIDIRTCKVEAQKSYLAKHTTKNVHMEGLPENIVEWYEQTKGLRLFEVFGTFRARMLAQKLREKEERAQAVKCPYCGATSGVFYARDGPRLFKDEWTCIKSAVTGGEDNQREIWDIRDQLETHLKEHEERKAQAS
jgi:hypothetical protein